MSSLEHEKGTRLLERRKEKRHPCNSRAKFRWILDKDHPFAYKRSQSFLPCRVADISASGATIEVYREANPAEQLEVYVPQEMFWGRVEVKHTQSLESDAYRVGVKFLERYTD